MSLLQIEREKGFQQGFQLGFQLGLQKGIYQGELVVLKKLLLRRFGPIPLWAEKCLEMAGRKDLEIWIDRILDAASVEEVFGIQDSKRP